MDSLTPVLYTLTFDTDGGDEIEPIRAEEDTHTAARSRARRKMLCICDWTRNYPVTDVVSADMTLKAVYDAVESSEQLNITSFSLDDLRRMSLLRLSEILPVRKK